jgi:hypothetical protein
MNKTTVVLLVILLGMAAAYVRFYTDLFRPKTIQIMAQVRPSRNTPLEEPGRVVTYPVTFAFDHEVKLTEVKVVGANDAASNKYPRAVWHLISDSNSVPVKALVYGQYVRGMKPKVPQARPEPLQPAVKYRLLLTAGKYKGQIDFKTQEVPGSGNQ